MEHVLILGAGSGIGAAVARRIAEPQSRMLLHTGSNRQRLEAVAQSCREAGAEVELCVGDMSSAELLDEIGRRIADFPEGGLSGLVFAAGYARLGTVCSARTEDLVESFQAMPVAFHHLVGMAAPKLAPQRGRVVCVSAFGAHKTRTYSYATTAPAKAALEAQVRVFAANFATRGIAVNAVVPGFIEKESGTPSSLTPEQWAEVTKEIPMQRIGRREEVAATIAFLLSENAGYITGQTIHVNGGMTL